MSVISGCSLHSSKAGVYCLTDVSIRLSDQAKNAYTESDKDIVAKHNKAYHALCLD